jgi:uncharacterized protein (DUF488 family)
MYYRRKILLALLDQFGGKLDKISLQKLLFLFVRQQANGAFHFVPYRFGCYSFQANADLNTLTKYNQVKETDKDWEKTDDNDYYIELSTKDKVALRFIKSQFEKFSCEELIALTYKNYPYFAINSTIAERFLTKDELKNVESQRPRKDETILFTIGYEGITLEQFINKLIVNDIKVLCDVRKNPFSMKFGFSKSQLSKACLGVNIEYKHIPGVGIESDKRQVLDSQADYDKLFIFYKESILPNKLEEQIELLELLVSKKRIALTCFEANIYQCHRKHLAEALGSFDDNEFEIRHI